MTARPAAFDADHPDPRIVQLCQEMSPGDLHRVPDWSASESKKAADEISDNLHRQWLLERQIAYEVAAARKATEAIKAIADIDFTPAVCAQIASVLATRVGACSWAHFPEAVTAIKKLDETHDCLTEGV